MDCKLLTFQNQYHLFLLLWKACFFNIFITIIYMVHIKYKFYVKSCRKWKCVKLSFVSNWLDSFVLLFLLLLIEFWMFMWLRKVRVFGFFWGWILNCVDTENSVYGCQIWITYLDEPNKDFESFFSIFCRIYTYFSIYLTK